MNEQPPARARRAVRNATDRVLRLGTVPIQPVVHAAVRVRPGLEPLAGRVSRLRGPGGSLPGEYLRATHDEILRVIGDRPTGRVLEIGCGEGLLTERLVPGADAVVAVDTADEPVARAAARFHRNPRVRVERRAPPFDRFDGSFDLIVCADSLHHWNSALLRRGLERLLARMRPGGRLVLLHHTGATGRGNAVHHATAVRIGADARFGHDRSEMLPGLGPDGSWVRLDVFRRAGTTVSPVPVRASDGEMSLPRADATHQDENRSRTTVA
jgi:SAM-dependent methyltransferase